MQRILIRSLYRQLIHCSSINACVSVPTSLNPTNAFHSSVPLLKRTRTRTKFIDPVIVKHAKSKKKVVEVYEDMTVLELASSLEESLDVVSDSLVEMDESNMRYLDGKTPLNKFLITNLCCLLDFKPRFVFRPNEEKLLKDMSTEEDVFPQPPAPDSECVRRSPVVTIMGHVDHGKTTLLDSLRNSSIVQSEFGGITQHIGAFSVQLPGTKNKVTFLDTPGHSAFKAMRERGAKATDIVVLVVAADDGVNEQTIESIKYAREANVPIVVAINKCDKPHADPAKTRRDLMQHGIVVEDMGGDVQVVEISALYGTNIKALQEALLLQADLMDLKATPKGLSEGVVIEASTSQGIGKVCTMVVQRGTVKRNTVFVAGVAWGRVKSMNDEHAKALKEAGPSTPVRIAGWRDDLPSPGERVLEVESEEKAQKIIEFRKKRAMDRKAEIEKEIIEAKRSAEKKQYLENRQTLLDRGIRFGSTYRLVEKKLERQGEREVESGPPVLKLMIQSDVDGTLEAILNVFDNYSSQLCDLQIVDFGVGPPNENQIDIAAETGALIYCFNISVPANVRLLAGTKGVEIEQFNVIYRLVDAIKARLSAKVPPKTELKQVGEGHVLKEFLVSQGRKKQPIAGTMVDWGVFNKNAIFRVIRGTDVIYEGPAESLKCENQFVNEAKTKTEVGISLEDKTIRFKEDDTIEVLEKEIIPLEIDWHPEGF